MSVSSYGGPSRCCANHLPFESAFCNEPVVGYMELQRTNATRWYYCEKGMLARQLERHPDGLHKGQLVYCLPDWKFRIIVDIDWAKKEEATYRIPAIAQEVRFITRRRRRHLIPPTHWSEDE